MTQAEFTHNILKERTGHTFTPKAAPDLEKEALEKPGYTLHRQSAGKATSLILEFSNGDISAPEYTYLVNKHFHKADGVIRLQFTHSEILLRGRNLQEIFRPLCNHRLAGVVEIPASQDQFSREVAIVNEIRVEALKDSTDHLE